MRKSDECCGVQKSGDEGAAVLGSWVRGAYSEVKGHRLLGHLLAELCGLSWGRQRCTLTRSSTRLHPRTTLLYWRVTPLSNHHQLTLPPVPAGHSGASHRTCRRQLCTPNVRSSPYHAKRHQPSFPHQGNHRSALSTWSNRSASYDLRRLYPAALPPPSGWSRTPFCRRSPLRSTARRPLSRAEAHLPQAERLHRTRLLPPPPAPRQPPAAFPPPLRRHRRPPFPPALLPSPVPGPSTT